MTLNDRIAAKDVAEAILELTSDALVTGNCDAFCSAFHLPLPVAVSGKSEVTETLDDLRRTFYRVTAQYKKMGVIGLERTLSFAEYTAPDRIESTHTSRRIMANAAPQEAYPVFSVIEKIGSEWKVTALQYAIEANDSVAQAITQSQTSDHSQDA